MSTTAAGASATALDPLLRSRSLRCSSQPPSPRFRRLSSDPEWSTPRKLSYFASYTPRSLYTAHQPPRFLGSSIHPGDRRSSGSDVKEPAVALLERKAEGSCGGSAIEDLSDRRELTCSERDEDVPKGGDRCRTEDLFDEKVLADASSGIEDSGKGDAENIGGTGRNELVAERIDVLVATEELVVTCRSSNQEGWIDGRCGQHEGNEGLEGGESESKELIGDQVDELGNWEKLTDETHNPDGSGGEGSGGLECAYLIGVENGNDMHNGYVVDQVELVHDQIHEFSVNKELVEAVVGDTEMTGCENGGGREKGGLSRDEKDLYCELCSAKEFVNETSGRWENGGEVCDGLGGEELVIAEVENLSEWKDLFSGNNSDDEENGCLESSELGSGVLMCDRIGDLCTRKDLVSGGSADGMEDGHSGHECDQLIIRSEEPIDVDLHNVLNDGSGRKSYSLLEKLESDLDSVRLNLLQEMEKRREIEEVLAHMQKQWKTLADYFSLVGLPSPLVPVGENQQLEDNPVHTCQEVVAAKFASTPFGSILSHTEKESSIELLIESKNCEIAQLHEKLKDYEAIDHALSQRNQEVAEISRKHRPKRKSSQKLMWTCIGFSVTIGASLVAYSFLLPTSASTVPSDSSCSRAS